MPVYTLDEQVLVDSDQVAISEDCCCSECPPTTHPTHVEVTIAGTGFLAVNAECDFGGEIATVVGETETVLNEDTDSWHIGGACGCFWFDTGIAELLLVGSPESACCASTFHSPTIEVVVDVEIRYCTNTEEPFWEVFTFATVGVFCGVSYDAHWFLSGGGSTTEISEGQTSVSVPLVEWDYPAGPPPWLTFDVEYTLTW